MENMEYYGRLYPFTAMELPKRLYVHLRIIYQCVSITGIAMDRLFYCLAVSNSLEE